MPNLFIVPIEPIPNRYTTHWYEFLPKQIEDNTTFNVVNIPGIALKDNDNGNAFLNFNSTVHYKNSQISLISQYFSAGTIKNGDVFLVTDAWNPAANMIRYMADLNDINIKMVGIWHAGAYDEWDFLGRKFQNKNWASLLEQAMYELYDVNVFATQYHYNLFKETRGLDYKSVITGFPMEYSDDLGIKFTSWEDKEDIVVFPHRKSVEKQPDLFKQVAKLTPEFKFVFAQDVCKSKQEYHELLMKSKIAFSANLQETLGIGMFEAVLAGCVPIVPNKLSYEEMYPGLYTYHSFEETPETLSNLIKYILANPNPFAGERLATTLDRLKTKFFNGKQFYKILEGFNNNVER